MGGRHEGPRNLGEALSWYFRPEHVVGRDSKRCPMVGMQPRKPRSRDGSPEEQQTGRVGPLQPPSEEREHGPPSGAL